MAQRWAVPLVVLSLFSGAPAQAGARSAYAISVPKSTLQICVYKEGLFKAFGHDHLISASMLSGRVLFNKETLEDSSVDLTVETASLRVIDPGESDEDRQKVQSTMVGKSVLDMEKFPVIRFSSTRLMEGKKAAAGWDVTLEGSLALHGVEKPVSLPLHLSEKDGELRAVGEVSILQTDFGITPIKVGGGAVKVKNKIRIRFDVVASKSRP
jgi:polyisoprenoid-binding protein YceI